MGNPRPGSEPPPEYAVLWLRCILDRRDRALGRVRSSEEELARAVHLVVSREHVSARELGRALGVGKSTIANWSKRGRELDSDG